MYYLFIQILCKTDENELKLEDPTTSCTAGRNGIDRRPKRRGDPR
jgi:hypothetical protein